MTDRNARAWRCIDKRPLLVRLAIEIGPALAFAMALQLTGLVTATAFFIAALVISTIYSWVQRERFPRIPVLMLILAVVLGGLTMIFREASYIEIRPTLVNGGGALVILIGLARGRLVLRSSLEEGFSMSGEAWRRLSLRMVVYLAAMAGLNELVRHSYSTESWAWFKTAMPVLNLLFLAGNWPLIRDDLTSRRPAAPVSGRVTVDERRQASS